MVSVEFVIKAIDGSLLRDEVSVLTAFHSARGRNGYLSLECSVKESIQSPVNTLQESTQNVFLESICLG